MNSNNTNKKQCDDTTSREMIKIEDNAVLQETVVHETLVRLSLFVGVGKSHPSSLHSTNVASVAVFFCLLGVCLLS